MQQITIWDESVRIQFLHQQQKGQAALIEIPASKLEEIVNEWVKKQPAAAKEVIENGPGNPPE